MCVCMFVVTSSEILFPGFVLNSVSLSFSICKCSYIGKTFINKGPDQSIYLSVCLPIYIVFIYNENGINLCSEDS